MDLLSLPIAIFCNVVCCRLSLIELVGLDAAFCCQKRKMWTQLLRSKQFTFQALVDISNVSQMRWLMRRDIKVLNIELIRELRITDISEISKYMRTYGSSLRSVHFVGRDKRHELNFVAIHCRSLTTLRFTKVTWTSEFTNILFYNPTIQRLDCEDVVCKETNLMEGLSLNKLQSLRMVGVNAGKKKGCLWHKNTHSDSLRTVI